MSKYIKTILITGGTSGMGKSILELLSSKGFKVVFTYYKRDKEARKLVNNLRKSNKNIYSFKINLEKHKDIDKLFTFAKKKLKNIDCLINNAAFFVERKKFESLNLNHVKQVMDINYFAVFRLCQLFAISNRKNKDWKTIINISSTAAKYGGIEFTHYAPTKAAIENLTKGLSRELAHKKIRVLSIAPGIIDTRDLFKKEKKSTINKMLSSIPNKRFGHSIEVANLVNYLIDKKSEYINGTTITISGGR
tara:strand:+ start:8668 stop:9414 length:747 start_codon:yes stop_codon:yes gene_type:complete